MTPITVLAIIFAFIAGVLTTFFIEEKKWSKLLDETIKEMKESGQKSKQEYKPDDIMQLVLKSHEAICKAKNMGPKEAYGHNPAIYYTLGVAGEAGEMANEIVKALRDGKDDSRVKLAVKKELPDVVIYSYILAHVLDIDLTDLVAEKVNIVIDRAESGYYGKTF
jgi:NTP pyrophosphatase (non-canonical NTP hydrolase)